MTNKADRLIQLVKGKILLRDAPTRRDIILELYGFDIDDENNKREKTDVEGECPAWERYVVIRKFTALLRSVRNREEKNTKDEDSLHDHNDCQFYMVQDEKVWHCVHIIQRINGNYLLKRGRIQQKTAETTKRTIEYTHAAGNLSEELRADMRANEIKNRWKQTLVKKYCMPKHIRSYITELMKEGKLPKTREDYRPNYKGIQHVFGENAGEVKHTVYEHMSWLHGQEVEPGRLDQRRMTYLSDEELIKNMTKDIILCDYLKQDYHRPEPQEADYLGIGK